MIVKSGKSSSGSPICSGLHSAAESAPVFVSPSGATAAVTADAAVPMLKRVSGVTGARGTTALQLLPGMLDPDGPQGGGAPGRRRADVEARVRGDGRPRDDVPPSEPFRP